MTTRREKWFFDGAGALRRTLTAHGLAAEILDLFPADGAYACPCCLIAYTRPALDDGPPPTLSDEHVPPTAVGTIKPMLLTCRPCNNRAGTVWDADAAEERHLTDAVTRQPSAPVDVTLTIGNIRVQGTYNGNGDLPTFTPIMKKNANQPADLDAATDRLLQAIDGTDAFEFTFTHRRRPDADAAAWSWVRAAYLAAFAVHGYRYALLAALEPLRSRFADPQPVPAPQLLISTGQRQLDQPRMTLIETPVALRSLVVDFGHVWVFLPAWQYPRTVADLELALQHVVAAEGVAGGRSIPWPTEPLYRLDPSA